MMFLWTCSRPREAAEGDRKHIYRHIALTSVSFPHKNKIFGLLPAFLSFFGQKRVDEHPKVTIIQRTGKSSAIKFKVQHASIVLIYS